MGFLFRQSCGEVTEWFKVHAWKVCVRQRTGGSNPPFSAIVFPGLFADFVSRKTGLKFDSRVLRKKGSRTPPGPEGSNGSEYLFVLQGCPAIIFLFGEIAITLTSASACPI